MVELPKELDRTLEFLQGYGPFYRGSNGVSFDLHVSCEECGYTVIAKNTLGHFRHIRQRIFYQHLQTLEELGLVCYTDTLSPIWRRLQLTEKGKKVNHLKKVLKQIVGN